jgi:hypothetical protein
MVLLVLFLIIPSIEGRDPTAWEQKESRKIFEMARLLEKQGQLEEAVKEYSEVLEFFPETELWGEACIRLSDLYLKTRREEQSQLVLGRLRRSAKKEKEDLGEDVLIAYVQNFVNREVYEEMKAWLVERSEHEKQVLRASSSLVPLWTQVQERSGLGPKALMELWQELGHQKPLRALIDLGREKDVPFSKELLAHLHIKAMEEGDVEALRSIVLRMVADGWGKVVHEQFKKVGQQADDWKSLWLHGMISGRLHQEALEVLDGMEDSQDRVIERMGVLIGLRRFEEGLHLLRSNANWLENALTFSRFEALLEGVLALPQGHLYREQFFEVLGEGGRKELLLARRVLRGKEKETKLESIALKDDFYGPMAAGDLGRLLAEEGRLEELRGWRDKVKERFPNSEELGELNQRVEILSGLKGEGVEAVPLP